MKDIYVSIVTVVGKTESDVGNRYKTADIDSVIKLHLFRYSFNCKYTAMVAIIKYANHNFVHAC